MAGNIEADQMRQMGVLPSYGADPIPTIEQRPFATDWVGASATATNGTVVVHTVTAGELLYLSAISLSFTNLSGGAAHGAFWVTDFDDTLQYYFWNAGCPDNDGKMCSLSFSPPLEIPSGHKIKVYSSAAGFDVTGFLWGFEK